MVQSPMIQFLNLICRIRYRMCCQVYRQGCWKTSSIGLLIGLFLLLPQPSYALDEIIHPFLSVRSMGMGGAIMTTGLYEENFFYNPARMTANPYSKFTLMQLTPETTSATLQEVSSLSNSGSNKLGAVANGAGKNLHAQLQFVLPAYYLAATEERKWSLSVGLIFNSQVNGDVRQSYQLNVNGLANIGPAVTYAHKFLADDALSVGVTGHMTYRMATNPTYSLANYFQGVPLSLSSIAGQGTLIDMDIGSTYKIIKLAGFQFSAAAAVQNVFGGNFAYSFINLSNAIQSQPISQPRTLGVGGSVEHDGWKFLGHSVLALEVYDIGNNSNGSFFRMLHLGAETHLLNVFAVRAGVNQGYLTAGLGFDAHYFELNLATYGVEMGLTPGTLEDRRYTMNLGFHI